MGQNESSVSGASRQPTGEAYLPVVGNRMNDEKIMERLRNASILTRPSKKNHVVRMAFAATWSQLVPNGENAPHSRIGHFFDTCDELGIVVCGLGITEDDTYLGDIWMLSHKSYTWSQMHITGDEISPRANAKGTIIGHILYIFGGFCDPVYFDDLFAIDLTNGHCEKLVGTGAVPSPRGGHVFASYNNRLYVWGGYDGLWPSDLHILDLESMVWRACPQQVQGRTGVSYQTVGDKIYCFGASKTGGLLEIDMEENSVSFVQTTGSEPQSAMVNTTMILFDRYLILIGGKAETEWTLIYACDLSKMWWFVLHLLPDEETLSREDGYISDIGLFMIPRTHSMAATYIPNQRKIVAFLGYKMKDPPPLFCLYVGDALGILTMKADMLMMLTSK